MFKKSISMIIILSFVFSLFTGVSFAQTPSTINSIFYAKNYVVYYDTITSQNVSSITSYDMAILEPSAVSDQMLATLKQSKTLLFSYVSAFEVERYDTLKTSSLIDSDYLYINGVKQYKSNYDCYLGDIRSSHYQDILLQVIKERVVDKGYSGVFLDTLDDIEAITDVPTKQALIQGYLSFLGRVKATYPNLLMIQNRAFTLYKAGSGQYIDAFLWESLKYEKIATLEYYQTLSKDLITLAKDNYDVILGLSHVNPAENYQLCQDLKWLFYYCPTTNNYLQVEPNLYNVSLVSPYAPVIPVKTVLEYAQMPMFLVSDADVKANNLSKAIITLKDGTPLMSYSKYVLDFTKPDYTNYLMGQFEKLYLEGNKELLLTFVTTLGKIPMNASSTSTTQLQGYIKFLGALKAKHPDYVLIQNRATEYLNNELAAVANGLYWDSFDSSFSLTSKSFQNQMAQINGFKSSLGWKIYIQANSNVDTIKNYCIQNGYTYIVK